MGTKYSSQTATGYNSSPPSDDGTAVSTNEVKWSFIKTKLGDPVKDLADNINTQLTTHFDESVTDKSTNFTTTTAEHKRTINATAAITISLGDASTMAAGYIVFVKNSHTAAITVDLATGTDTLDGTVDGSVDISAGNSVRFIVNSGASGYLKTASGAEIRPTEGTEVATTSGTSVLFSSIPSWVKKVDISFVGVSSDSTGSLRVQLGDAGGIETSGYTNSVSTQIPNGIGPTISSSTSSAAFIINVDVASHAITGTMMLTLKNSATNEWVCSGNAQGGVNHYLFTGSKALSDVLTQIQVSPNGGNFDAGSINILYY